MEGIVSAVTDFDLDVAAWLGDDDVQQHARSAIADYFASFTGRWFERFVAQSEPTQFTATDMVAVTTLSVDVPANAAAELLLPGPCRDRCGELLAASPGFEVELWSAGPSAIADEGPLAQLYREVRQIPGLGRTKTSKLLAAKRPGLVPIRDELVERFVGAGTLWWQPMQQIMLDAKVRDILSSFTPDVVHADVTLQRRLDVVLWTAASADPTGDKSNRWRRSRR